MKVGVTAVVSPGALKIKKVGARRSNCGENRCPIPRFTMVPAEGRLLEITPEQYAITVSSIMN